jgi:hypothetical protein
MLKLPQLESIQVIILRQFRSRRQRGRNLEEDSLFVDLGVTARHESTESDAMAYDFDATLEELFQSLGAEFIRELKATGDPYFGTVEEVLLAMEGASSPSTPTESPALPPATPDEEDEGVFSLGLIVGISVGGAVVLAFLVLLCRRMINKPDVSDHQSFNSGPALTGDQTPKRKWLRKNSKQETKMSSSKKSAQGYGSDVESQGIYSYAPGENDSFMGGSIMQNQSIMGADTMSYAYSLDAGIEPSVYSDGHEVIARAAGRIPYEIPQIRIQVPEEKPFSMVSSTQDSEFEIESSFTGFDAEDISLVPSELQLTESELEMLPSNLAKSSSDGDAQSSLPTKEVLAPPGKLGIIIDTTVEGPVVHNVNEGSALKGKIWPGDIIIAIDDVDTRAMSASAITSLMVKTANQLRTLTVVSDPNR